MVTAVYGVCMMDVCMMTCVMTCVWYVHLCCTRLAGQVLARPVEPCAQGVAFRGEGRGPFGLLDRLRLRRFRCRERLRTARRRRRRGFLPLLCACDCGGMRRPSLRRVVCVVSCRCHVGVMPVSCRGGRGSGWRDDDLNRDAAGALNVHATSTPRPLGDLLGTCWGLLGWEGATLRPYDPTRTEKREARSEKRGDD